MITAKAKISYQCSNCKANHAKQVGKCHFCNSWNTVSEITIEKKFKPIAKQSAKTIEANKANKGVETDLDKWFKFQREYELANGRCVCENCGCSVANQLNSKDTWVWRGTIAHVIGKAKFPSVATHIHNYLILCLQCHNAEYDYSWDKAIKSKVFPLAKTKFKLFQSAIKEPLGKLPPELIN
jgi:hypothetical protein